MPTQGQLRSAAEQIRAAVRFDSAGVPRKVSLPSEFSGLFRDFGGDLKYRILDPSGRAIVSSDSQTVALAPVGRRFDSTRNSFTVASGDETLSVTTEPVMHGAQTYYIQVAMSSRFTAFVRTVAARMRARYILRLSLASLALVTIAVYFTLRRVLRPLRETSAAAARVDTRNLSQRLATQNLPTEFLPVVDAFNLTLDRLEKGYSVQRAFLADAAHELKTPLALIRAQIDIDGTADRQALLQDIDGMARQVNQLLHLAEASETQNYVFASVDAAEVAEDVVDYLRRLADSRGVYLENRCVAGIALVLADRGAFFMLLKNLVENAIQHSPVGGAVAITITTSHLSVRDGGPGIATADLPQLFKRFWRGPTRRNAGAGLGLSICAEIAAAHKWGLTANSVGQGAEFALYFDPATAS
jgi:signal transduction histidine kinase